MATATETVYLVEDHPTENIYFMVESGEDSYYFCDADGDKVHLSDYSVLEELGTIPADDSDDSDAFFALIVSKAKRVETKD